MNVVYTIVIVFIISYGAAASVSADCVYNTNHSAYGNFGISTQGRVITLTAVPESDVYSYCMISLYQSSSESTLNKQVIPYQVGSSYDVSSIPNGEYYLQLYRGTQKSGVSYYPLYYYEKGIRLRLSDNDIALEYSPVYEHNKTMSSNARFSEMALDYYLLPDSCIESEDEQICALATQITMGATSDYEKVRLVYEWVCNNIWYDYDSYLGVESSDYSVQSTKVLKSKKSVCEGFADLTAALLRSQGIPTKVISGYALGVSTKGAWNSSNQKTSKTNHAWNEAYVDGRWVILDTTWGTNNKYQDGEYSTGTGMRSYRYFDPTLEIFSMSHKIQEDPFKEYYKELKRYCKPLRKRYYVSLSNKLVKKNKNRFQIKMEETSDETSKRLLQKYSTIQYSSSNKKVATVTSTGKVRVKKKGNAVITVKVTFDGKVKKYKIKFLVVK